ncbi:MAG: hypothetical protein ABTS16_17485, partial [Candidatus Accumulibacter phosphatis]
GSRQHPKMPLESVNVELRTLPPFRVNLVQVLCQPGKGSRFSPAGISREPSAAKTQVLSIALWQKVIRHRLFD